MKICPKCSWAAVIDDDRFCYNDGAELVEQRIHECGREISLHDKFCPKCGKGVAPVTAEYTVKVEYIVAGGHTHVRIRAGKTANPIKGLCGEMTMTNDEFAAWRKGQAAFEFVVGGLSRVN